MTAEEPHVPNPDILDQPDLNTAIEAYFNPTSVIEELWRPSSSLGRISTASLGIYSLSVPEVERPVANWTPIYELQQANFNSELALFIRGACDRPAKWGMSLADILTAQSWLSSQVVSGDELVAITERLARDPAMGLDNLIMLSGILSKMDLAILLAKLPDTRTLNGRSKNSIKIAARTVDNMLFDEPQVAQSSPAVNAFKEVVDRARSSDEIQRYPEDILFTKIFFKREDTEHVAMVRRVDVGNFAAWMKAYGSERVWKDLGLQHIPVEPILNFSFSPRYASVDCRTVLLRSSSFAEAIEHSTPEESKLIHEQRLKIKKGLDRCGVIHGHLHSDNLQVVVTDHGPQVYVIDFDRAYIKKDLKA